MIKAHLMDGLVPKQEALAVTNRKHISFAFNQNHNEGCTSAGVSHLGEFLLELVVELEESFVHQDFNHLIEVTSLVQHSRPFLHSAQQVVPEIRHALAPSVTVKHPKQTDQLPLAASHVLLDQKAILHLCPSPQVQDTTRVEPVQFEH